jgi:phytoene synthase
MPQSAADLAACTRMLRGGSRSFRAASLLLPARVRDSATALYAFCRIADDAVDLGRDPGAAASLRRRLEAIARGQPGDDPADRAFAIAMAQHAIPRALPEALIEGLEWDAAGRRYATLADLSAYAVRVAGAVGVMMALAMGARDARALARAADLGIAMQFTNIARDIGEDARNGRVYLPLAWLAEAGIDADAFLAEPRFTPALGTVVARLLAEAARLYARADAGIAALPRDCRFGIRAASRIYAAIGDRVASHGYDSVSTRAVVPAGGKLSAVLRALGGAGTVELALPVLPPARFLLEAVAAFPQPQPRPAGITGRLLWVAELFQSLETREAGA